MFCVLFVTDPRESFGFALVDAEWFGWWFLSCLLVGRDFVGDRL